MKKILIILFLIVFIYIFGVDTELTLSYYMYDGDGTYTVARDNTDASNDSSGSVRAGQNTNFNVYRGYLEVPIPALSSVTSCFLHLYGDDDDSATDYDIMLYEGTWVLGLVKGDFNEFDGWRAENTHNGTSLTDGWNTSGMVVDGWNIIEFNAAGRAAVLAAEQTTMRICVVSSEDVARSQPTGDEVVVFNSISAEGKEPFLRISSSAAYTGTACGVNNPAGVCGVAKAQIKNFCGVE